LSAQFRDISYLAPFDRKESAILFRSSPLFPFMSCVCVCVCVCFFCIASYFHQQRGLVVYILDYFTSFCWRIYLCVLKYNNHKINYFLTQSNTSIYFLFVLLATGSRHYGHHQTNVIQKFKKNGRLHEVLRCMAPHLNFCTRLF
jgi:predicted neutral ceramidase superfamily lipid hydrolase